jgi:hypothetical protein
VKFEARLREHDEVEIDIAASRKVLRKIVASVIPPSMVERSTGTFRSPESMIDLPEPLVAELIGLEPPQTGDPVIGLLVHAVSRRAAAIGVFQQRSTASSWWSQPYNRLAKNPDVLFLLVPVVGGFST